MWTIFSLLFLGSIVADIWALFIAIIGVILAIICFVSGNGKDKSTM
jgi:hypothetical protein